MAFHEATLVIVGLLMRTEALSGVGHRDEASTLVAVYSTPGPKDGGSGALRGLSCGENSDPERADNTDG